MHDDAEAAVNSSTRDVVGQLADCLQEDDVVVDRRRQHDRLWLPQAPESDYRFYVDTFDAGEAATLGALLDGESEDGFFWHLPFEYPAHEERQALGVLVQETRRVVLSRSRILQRRGFLLWNFWCEVEEGRAWKRVGGTVACMRKLFAVPRSDGTLREYRSGPPRPRA